MKKTYQIKHMLVFSSLAIILILSLGVSFSANACNYIYKEYILPSKKPKIQNSSSDSFSYQFLGAILFK